MELKKLTKLRRQIDRIDSHILELVNIRGKLGHEIGNIKKRKGAAFYSPDRESEIYARITKKNRGPLTNESLKAIYREIMSGCLSLEQPMRAAYLGPELTFTHQAALKKFGASIDYLSCDSIADVFREVEKNNADYGVVPIENSTEGAISHTLDMFVDSPLIICSEVYQSIHLSLLSKAGNMRSIKKIYSNPQVFGQCRTWIEKNLPGARLRDVSSTAKAAKIAAESSEAGCIASELAAKKYKLKIIARSIEDSSTNVTRFLVIGHEMSRVSRFDKTSIVFSVKDRPGALHDMLSSFKRRNINLTKIESRPSKKKPWKYYFFVDMEGHAESPKVKRTLKELERKCYFLKVLGSYPRG